MRNLAPLGELQAAHAAVLEKKFADWEGRWRECRECLPEVIPAVQHLSEKSESSRAELLTYRGFATGSRIGELEIALRIVQQEEALYLELGNKDSLQRSYGNQAVILQAWGRLEEAMALHKKQEALYLELGKRSSLAYCYWAWGLLAREQRDRKAEREKLAAALQTLVGYEWDQQTNSPALFSCCRFLLGTSVKNIPLSNPGRGKEKVRFLRSGSLALAVTAKDERAHFGLG